MNEGIKFNDQQRKLAEGLQEAIEKYGQGMSITDVFDVTIFHCAVIMVSQTETEELFNVFKSNINIVLDALWEVKKLEIEKEEE